MESSRALFLLLSPPENNLETPDPPVRYPGIQLTLRNRPKFCPSAAVDMWDGWWPCPRSRPPVMEGLGCAATGSPAFGAHTHHPLHVHTPCSLHSLPPPKGPLPLAILLSSLSLPLRPSPSPLHSHCSLSISIHSSTDLSRPSLCFRPSSISPLDRRSFLLCPALLELDLDLSIVVFPSTSFSPSTLLPKHPVSLLARSSFHHNEFSRPQRCVARGYAVAHPAGPSRS